MGAVCGDARRVLAVPLLVAAAPVALGRLADVPMRAIRRHACRVCRRTIAWALACCFSCNQALCDAGHIPEVAGEFCFRAYEPS